KDVTVINMRSTVAGSVFKVGTADQNFVASGVLLEQVQRRVFGGQAGAPKARILDDRGGKEFRYSNYLSFEVNRLVEQLPNMIKVIADVRYTSLHLQRSNTGFLHAALRVTGWACAIRDNLFPGLSIQGAG